MVSKIVLNLVVSLYWSTAWGHTTFNITVLDVTRDRAVPATICLPRVWDDTSDLDLVVFGHGGGLFPADYSYLCNDLRPTDAIARLGSLSSDDPMDLELVAADMSFLARELPQQSRSNASSPLSKRLNGRVLLAGHSMGAAAALLAGSIPNDHVVAVGVMAPGFWGDKQAALLEKLGSRRSALCNVPLLQLVGDQDCANSLRAQALPVWGNITASCGNGGRGKRSLAVLRGATHCQWATPVQGDCPFDVPCPAKRLERSRQQQLGTFLLNSLGRHSLSADLRLMESKGALSYVDENSSASDISQLHSFCPCGNTSNVEWV